MMCFRSSLTLLVAFLPALLFAGEVKTLSGQTVEGTLVRLAVDGVVVRPKEGQEKTLPLAEVLAIELAPASKEAPDPTAVRHRIRQLIEAESPADILSDDTIAELLKRERGIDVARRTVAKYRAQLGILPSVMR